MPMPTKYPKHEVQLDEPVLKYLETKKENTRIAYEKCLYRFRYFYGKPLAEFIKEIEIEIEANKTRGLIDKIRPGEDTIRRFIQWHKEKGFAPKSTRQSIGALQNFLKYYGISMSYDFIELPPSRPLERNDKHEWTLDQVKQLVDSAEYLRDKALILIAFQSGLGISDILDLDYGDIKQEFEAGIIPLVIEGYRKKTGVKIRTFVGRDAVSYLRLYLKPRIPLKRDDPLFTKLGTSKRLTGNAVRKQFRVYAQKLGFIVDEDLENGYNPARPHSLRSGFRSRLTGKMDEQLIEFFMAHDIGEEKRTYINMPIDELREIYANYEHLLAVEKTSKDELAERLGKEKIPDEALERIQTLEVTVTRLAEQNTKLEEAKMGQNSRVAELEVQLRSNQEELRATREKQQEILKLLAGLQKVEEKEED
jgi:integrase